MGTRSGSGGILGRGKSVGGGDYDEEQQEQEEECDVGLGLRMQLNENNSGTASSSSSVFPDRKADVGALLHGSTAAATHHHHHLHYLNADYVSGGSFYGDTTNINQISYMGLGGGGEGPGNSLQAPDCFASGGNSATKAAKSLQHHPLSISGKMVASGNVWRVPFTAAQWLELERQNMILKYMMASVPVPPELLLPISTTKSSNVVPPSRGGGDPEPWRCRTTDGKKWRCSRDVAPHQKYCERHSHKNRPRSRKPVELPPAAAASATADYLLNPTAKSTSSSKRSLASQPQHQHHQPPVDSRHASSSHFVTPFDQDTPSSFPHHPR